LPQIGWYLPESKRRVLFDEALDEARLHGDLEGFPYEVLNGMHQQAIKERPDAITVTSLLQNARHVKLEKANAYFENPANQYATFRGNIVHNILESFGGPDAQVESRVTKDFHGTPISGQPDTVQIRTTNGRTLLRDWKTTKELPRYDNPYTNHMQQVNLYRWLLGLSPEDTDLEVVYISMEGVKVIPLKHGGVSSRGRKITEQHWSDEKVEEFIDQRLTLYNTEPILRYEDIPEEDMWQCRYSPVENLCRRLAAREAREAWEQGREVARVPERIVSK
jgi:hypothetical protein